MRYRLQSSTVFVVTLIVGADSVGVACEYQTFIVEETLADKILIRDPTESVGLYMILLQTRSSYAADPT